MRRSIRAVSSLPATGVTSAPLDDEHVVPREEWQKVEQLPAVAIRGKSVETTN
jgi:hypothetical protein